MATASSTQGVSLMDCSLCLSIYRQPKCLPCIHTFCLDCLQMYVDTRRNGDQISCPLCRKVHTIPPQGLSSLPSNFFVQNMIDLGSLAGVKPEKQNNSASYCERHRNELLRLHCRSCDEDVCVLCMVGDHNGHKCVEYISKNRDLFESIMLQLRNGVIALGNTAQKLNAVENEVVLESHKTELDIRNRCNEIRNMLDNFEEELLGVTRQFEEERGKSIKKQIREVELQNTKLESLIQHMESMMERGCLSDSACLKELQNRAEALLSTNYFLDKTNRELELDRVHFIPNDDHSGFQFDRKLIGRLFRGEKTIAIPGMTKHESYIVRKRCHISLDQPDKVHVNTCLPVVIKKDSAACVVDNTLYLVGVDGAGAGMYKWSACSDEWVRCKDLPLGLSKHCVTSVGGKIYVLGGWNDKDKITLDDILSYDITSERWLKVNVLPHSVLDAACVTHNQLIYVFGGGDRDNMEVNYVQVYDTITGRVHLQEDCMPTAQRLLRAVVWNTKAILVGRYACYIYDFEARQWAERNRFCSQVDHFGLTLDNDTLYISGGGQFYDHVWTNTNTVKSLLVKDLVSDNKAASWKRLASLPVAALVDTYSEIPMYIRPSLF